MKTIFLCVLFLLISLFAHFTTTQRINFTEDQNLHSNTIDARSDDDLEGRIVGGRLAERGEAPYQLSLMRERRAVCGATLIESPCSGKVQLGITAAHCVCGYRTNSMHSAEMHSVRGGSTNKYAGETQYIKKIVIHESYDGTYHDDIALLFFENNFKLSTDLKTLRLPGENTNDEDIKELIVSGWGNMNETGQGVTDLRILRIPVLKNEECAHIYEKHHHNRTVIFPTSICAGVPEGGEDACQGDSGGPAVAEDDEGQYLAGVVSWGKGCARAGFPTVYMRVSQYVKWIVSNAAPREHCSKYETPFDIHAHSIEDSSVDEEDNETYLSTSGLLVLNAD